MNEVDVRFGAIAEPPTYVAVYGAGAAVMTLGGSGSRTRIASRKGATIGWVRRYQAADGQLYAALLAAYLFLTLLPLLLVESSHVVRRSGRAG